MKEFERCATEVAEHYGFAYSVTFPSMHGIGFIDNKGIALTVTERYNEISFELSYEVTHSIFRLSTPVCSPFDSRGFFEKMYNKFKSYVDVLERMV